MQSVGFYVGFESVFPLGSLREYDEGRCICGGFEYSLMHDLGLLASVDPYLYYSFFWQYIAVCLAMVFRASALVARLMVASSSMC